MMRYFTALDMAQCVENCPEITTEEKKKLIRFGDVTRQDKTKVTLQTHKEKSKSRGGCRHKQ